VPQPHGGALYAGGVLGNAGGGRPPDEFKRRMAQCASRDETIAALEEILRDKDHPHFMRALEFCADRGYGKVVVELRGGLANLDMNRLTDEQLQRVANGEPIMAVLASNVERVLLRDELLRLPPGGEGP